MNNIIMNNPSKTQKVSRSTLVLLAALAGLVYSASAQTPTPSPTWPPPQGTPQRDQLIKAVAGLLRDSAVGDITVNPLRGKLQSPASAKTELQNKLGASLQLPPTMMIVFYEPDIDSHASCTVQPKNGLYSVFALSKTAIPSTTPDKTVVNDHFMCCYDPY